MKLDIKAMCDQVNSPGHGSWACGHYPEDAIAAVETIGEPGAADAVLDLVQLLIDHARKAEADK